MIFEVFIAASIITCPAYLRADEQVANLPKEWNVVNPHLPKRLVSAEVLTGEISHNRAIHPRVDKDRNLSWPNTTENFWLKCYYRDSDVKIYRSVKGEHSCQFLTPRGGTGHPGSMICTPVNT